MAPIAILGTLAFGLLHLTSCGRPQSAAAPFSEKLERDAGESSSGGVSVQPGGAFVSVARQASEEERQLLTPRATSPQDGAEATAPSMLALKQDAAALLGTQSGAGSPTETQSGTPTGSGTGTQAATLATGNPPPPQVQSGTPGTPPTTAATEERSPYKAEGKFRPAEPPASELYTKSNLKTYDGYTDAVKGGPLKVSDVYSKVRDKLIGQENLILSKEFDIKGFAEKGHTSFVKNVEYHTALQKYIEGLFKMAGGAHAVTEREYHDQDKRAKAIQEKLDGDNIEFDPNLPPSASPAHSPATNTPHSGNTPTASGNTPTGNTPTGNTPPAPQHTTFFYDHPTFGKIETEAACGEKHVRTDEPGGEPKALSSANKKACKACVTGGKAKMDGIHEKYVGYCSA